MKGTIYLMALGLAGLIDAAGYWKPALFLIAFATSEAIYEAWWQLGGRSAGSAQRRDAFECESASRSGYFPFGRSPASSLSGVSSMT